MEQPNSEIHKIQFYAEIEKIKEECRKIYTKETINSIIQSLNEAKNNPNTKLSSQYYYLRQFQLFEIGGVTRLIRKMTQDDLNVYLIVPFEVLVDEINNVHINSGHGGVSKMKNMCKTRYDNIHQRFLTIYNQFCHGCQLKRCKAGSKKVVVKPIISKYFMNRGQLDLVDFQSMPDGINKWVMHYQEV